MDRQDGVRDGRSDGWVRVKIFFQLWKQWKWRDELQKKSISLVILSSMNFCICMKYEFMLDIKESKKFSDRHISLQNLTFISCPFLLKQWLTYFKKTIFFPAKITAPREILYNHVIIPTQKIEHLKAIEKKNIFLVVSFLIFAKKNVNYLWN